MLWIFRETGLENEMEYLIRMKLITITMTINNNLFLWINVNFIGFEI